MLSPGPDTSIPWIVLVVVEEGPGVSVTSLMLTLTGPASITRELVDLREAWVWVHAHGTGIATPVARPRVRGRRRMMSGDCE